MYQLMHVLSSRLGHLPRTWTILFVLLYEFQLARAQLGTGSVSVSSGAQFAKAIGNPTVTKLVLVNDISFLEGDFPEGPASLVTRNVTVEGLNGSLPYVVLDLANVKQKVQLWAGITLTFRRIILVNFREGPVSATPGFDMLAPTKLGPNNVPSLLLVHNCTLILRWCYPPQTQVENMRGFSRAPQLPGSQNVSLRLPQPGCVNSSQAPLWQRCWPSYGMYWDLGLVGADPGPSSQPDATNIIFWLLHTHFACSDVMTEACVQQLTPLGCFLYMMSLSKQRQKQDEGGDSGRSVLLPVLVGVLGGAAVVSLAAGGAVFLLLRRRRGAQLKAAEEAEGKLSPESAEVDRALKAGAEVWVTPIGRLVVEGSADPPSDGPSSSNCQDDNRLEQGAGSGCHLHVVVTPLTPPRSDLALGVECGGEVQLLPVVRGKGSFGRVVEGIYGGRRVAVKLLPCDVLGSAANAGDADAAAPPLEAARGQSGQPEGGLDRGKDGVLGGGGSGSNGGAAAAAVAVAEGGGGGGGVSGGQQQQVQQPQEEPEPQQARQGGERGGGGERELATFAQEVEVLGRCCHPNVVRLLAACLGPPQPCLVMELMETSLDKMLHEQKAPLLPLTTVLHIAIDVARGLEYLHPTIVHRDLKPANVLVNMSGPAPVAKLSDFGLARMRNTVMPTRHPEAGTPAYMAPECFDTQNLKITHQADVYSFAVILWEMLTGQLPWYGCAPLAVAYTVTLLGERLPLHCIPPDRCPPTLARLMADCFDAEPRRRPAAAEIVKELQMLLKVAEAGELPLPLPQGVAPPPLTHLPSAAAAGGAAGPGLRPADPSGASPVAPSSPQQEQRQQQVLVDLYPVGESLPSVGSSSGWVSAEAAAVAAEGEVDPRELQC